mmetsp:Transcript_18894/g.47553  ORF Transcript_18894/g.47553 Transcript_18894/m.47553 type:complete len:83 (-) Transcript_18894:263-511(-)
MTAMVSACCSEERRCVMTSVVHLCLAMILLRAALTSLSLSPSSPFVASSSIRILGSLTMALAMTILCFCPPLSCWPFSPQYV